MPPIFAISRHRIATDGKGVTTLVAMHGCPLSCRYCLNPQCKNVGAVLQDYSPQQLLSEVTGDNLYFLATGGGITFGGGEPLQYPDFIAEFRHICPEQWTVNIETSLNVPLKNLMIVAHLTDRFIIDIKDTNPKIYRKYTNRDNSQMLNNLQWLVDEGLQDRCKIRLPLIPGYNKPRDISRSRIALAAMGFRHFEEFRYITDNR